MSDQGLEAEVRALIAADDGGEGLDQLALAFEDMPSPVEQLAQAKGVQLRGRGRPPGSRNRSTLDVVKYLKATGRPTLLTLRDWAALPFDEFKRLTGITDADKAFSRWLQVAELVTAYEEGRPTQRVELGGSVALPVMVMRDEPVRPDLADGNAPAEADVVDVVDFTVREGNQALSRSAAEQVSRGKSHDDSEPVEWQGETGD